MARAVACFAPLFYKRLFKNHSSPMIQFYCGITILRDLICFGGGLLAPITHKACQLLMSPEYEERQLICQSTFTFLYYICKKST